MNQETFLVLGAVLLCGALILEYLGRKAGHLIVKTALSSLFLSAALTLPQIRGSYFCVMGLGLALCLVGDICLALPQDRAFLLGLVAFLLGHVAYVLGFLSFGLPGVDALWSGAPVCLVSGAVLAWLWPRLGSMRGPVTLYVLVISGMVAAAILLTQEASLDPAGRGLVLMGAMAFYVSDIFVARDRFVAPGFVNRLIGLPLYYGAQFLLAFSVARLPG